MLKPNKNYAQLKDAYLFTYVNEKTKQYLEKNKAAHILNLGVGDVSLPLCDAVIKSLHKAVDDQGKKKTFQGYMPECGMPFFRKAVASYYGKFGVSLSPDEVFVSSGACDELADIIDLFDISNSALVMEPAYPAYLETNILAGRRIFHIKADQTNGFVPLPDENKVADIIYICSPNNPTGAVFGFDALKKWVDFANAHGSVIIFDAAYEIFIESPNLPHSIYEIPRAKECAIEICSFSKTAGFTGTRLGYTVVPKALKREGMSLNDMWTRNRLSKTNGVSYIIQKGAIAVFTDEGQKQIKENIDVYKKNAKVLMKALGKIGIWYCGGENAPYIWMKTPTEFDSWSFFDYLLDKAQIVGTPGVGFGKCGEGFFRLSCFGNPKDTKEAAKRLTELF